MEHNLLADRQTGYPSIDKPWLKRYSEDNLKVTVPDVSMFSFIYESNKNRLDNTAILYFGNSISYQKMFDKIKRLAGALYSYGIRKGDIISLISLNTPETTYIIYAANYLGAVVNLISATSQTQEIVNSVKETESQIVFILDILLEKHDITDIPVPVIKTSLSDSASGLMKFVMKIKTKKYHGEIEDYKDFLNKYKGPIPEIAMNGKLPALIIYTSGTTGNPKGVVITNYNMNAVATMCYVSGKNYKPNESFLNNMPPFISFGISMLHLCFYSGMREIAELLPDVKTTQKMLKKYRPERFVFGPILSDIILTYPGFDLSFLIDLTGGGGAISEEKEESLNKILEEKKAGTKYLSGYGMTELSAAVSMNHNDANKSQSIGLPLSMINLKIIDVNTKEELSYNQEGELLICSPGIMMEYYKNEKETKEIIEIIDGKRWLHTGDLAKIDEDGFVFITGRIKRLYVTRGKDTHIYKIFPQRMEDVIEGIEGINRCGVIAIEDKDREHVPVVFISTNTFEIELIKKKVAQCIETNLPEYYKPKEIIVIEEFPTTTSQKIDYKKLEEAFKNLL